MKREPMQVQTRLNASRLKDRTRLKADPQSSELERLKLTFDVAISFFSLLWKTLPVWTVVAGLLFWRYLTQIGRPDLLISSLSNGQGLIAFLGTFVLLCLATLFLLAVPSFYFIVVHRTVGADLSQQAKDSLPKHLMWLAGGVGVGVLALTYTQWRKPAAILLGVALGVVGPFVYDYLRNRDFAKLKDFFGPTSRSRSAHLIAYLFAMFLGGFLTIWPSTVVLPLIDLNEDAWYAAVSYVAIMAAAAVVSLMPAIALIRETMTGGTTRKQFLAFSVTLCVVAYLFFIQLQFPITDRLINTTVTKLGIRIMEPYRYRVVSKALGPTEFATERWRTKDSTRAFIVDAVVPLSFGDVRLLCPRALKNNDILQKKAAVDCVDLRRDEVRRIPDSGPLAALADDA